MDYISYTWLTSCESVVHSATLILLLLVIVIPYCMFYVVYVEKMNGRVTCESFTRLFIRNRYRMLKLIVLVSLCHMYTVVFQNSLSPNFQPNPSNPPPLSILQDNLWKWMFIPDNSTCCPY